MGRLAVAFLGAMLVWSLAPAPTRVCAEHHIEPDSVQGLGVVLLQEPPGPGSYPPDERPQRGHTLAAAPRKVRANSKAAEKARSCECLLVYVGRGGSCPVLCIMVVDNRPPSRQKCSSRSRWLCECRQVVEGLMGLLGW